MILMKDMLIEEEVQIIYESMCQFKQPRKRDADGYRQIAEKWIRVIPYQCLKRRSFTSGNIYQISLAELRTKYLTNRYIENNKQKFWFDWLHANYPLWQELNKGNNIKGEYTTVALKFDIQAVLSTAEPSDVYQAFLDEMNPDDHYENIMIDLESLQNYIRQTEESKTFNSGKMRQRMEKNIVEAKIIEALAIGYNHPATHPKTLKEYWALPQTYKQDGNARRYYTGSIALQRCHSIVREACMGKSVELDINTAVFAFFKTIVEDMMGETAPVLTQYLNDKTAFRNSIAGVLSNTRVEVRGKRVKQCITAMGFGAESEQYGSIDKILRNADDLEAFNSHPYVVELKSVIDRVHEFLKVAGKERIDELRGREGWMAGRSFKYKRFYAHVYQEWETSIMEELQDFIQTNGGEVVLWVHDGIYTRGPLDLGYQHHIQSIFGKFVTFERKDINSWKYTNPVAGNDEVLEHRARMLREDYKARGYDVSEISWNEWMAEARQHEDKKTRTNSKNNYNQSFYDGSNTPPDTWSIH